MSVIHLASHTDTQTPFLAAGATNYSSAPPEAARDGDIGAAGLRARPGQLAAWKPLQLPNPPSPILDSQSGRGVVTPPTPFVPQGEG